MQAIYSHIIYIMFSSTLILILLIWLDIFKVLNHRKVTQNEVDIL